MSRLLVHAAGLLCLSATGRVAAELFNPGEILYDTSGAIIRAHQPHMYLFDGAYDGGTAYLIGSDQVGSSDGESGIVNLYTSDDLHAWKYEGIAYNRSGDARPSLLGRNPRTDVFVLWAKGGSFNSGTAQTVDGPYTFYDKYEPSPGCTAGDSASFLDPVSGDAYMVYSQHLCDNENARAMKLLMLDDDWTAPAAGAEPVATVDGNLEAPCPFYSNLTKLHYIWCSHTSGWNPNQAALLVSSDGMTGPWSSLGNPSNNSTTFDTQGSHIEPLPAAQNPPGVERFLYMGDRYEPYIDTYEGSRYIFLALEVRSNGDVVLFPDEPWGLGDDWPTEGGVVLWSCQRRELLS